MGGRGQPQRGQDMILEEQETIINYSRTEDVAYIWTSDSTVMTKLDKFVSEGTYKLTREERDEDGTLCGKWYECPKNWISFRHTNRITNETQRAKSAETLRKMWEKKRAEMPTL